MKLQQIILTCFLIVLANITFAQDGYVGKWKTVDDNTGEAKAYVQIYEQGGKLFGKIEKVLDETKADEVCVKCNGAKKNQKIEGLVILEDLKKKGDYFGAGKITDPENGKEYKCYIELESDSKLKVRGYVGVAALGRTQYWYKVN